jgi:2'-5' RNA ligase
VKRIVTVYWLIPAEPYRELFRELIRILAKEFDAPKFFPHLTLGQATGRQSPRTFFRQIKNGPVRLRVRGIGFSAKFTQTLFIRFHSNEALKSLVVDLGVNRNSLRDPHISLIYKRLTARTKKALASTIKLPFREVVFDSIEAVRCISPTETRREVESWRMVATKRLSG